MPTQHPDHSEPQELDVRALAKPEKHPTIFRAYAALPVGGSLVLVNDHDPLPLRQQFEADHAGSYGWQYVSREPREWRIEISKLSSTPLPRVLVNTQTLATEGDNEAADATGAVWKLAARERDLDSNIIALAPGGTIAAHVGAPLDVLIHVLAGSGQITTELGVVDLTPGALLWLPRLSQRQFTAGAEGLRYLTVHQRKPGLMLGATK